MVAAVRDSSQHQHHHQQPPQPQPQPPQPPQAAAVAVSSAEDEALKRNTDCVYFLASPLTCKKGSECEYRHSEYARMNPRDCWYWLNGNCLNPKCAYRHPPLDGLLGTQAATSAGPSLPTSQTAAAINATYNPGKQVAATNAIYNPVKQAVPCIFFQKGLCLKGDRCAFSHGLNPVISKVPQASAAAPVSEPPNLKKAFGGLEKCSNEQKLPQANASKSTEVLPKVKLATKSETAISKNGIITEKSGLAPTRFNNEVSGHIETYVHPVTNGNTMAWSNHMPQNDVSDDHSLQNGKDADEFYRESSPGFDVLVDDELRDSDYYHDDDQFGRRGHEGRNLNEFDVGGSADYNTVADVDREIFRDPRGYDSYDRMQGQYDWNQRRASSERKSVGPDHLERRGYRKTESPDRMEESDLRHRLSKQRRVGGLRSVISHDYAPDNHDEERSYRGSRKDSRNLPPHESSLSSRLRGRIKIPERSSPVDDDDLRSERDLDRGRNYSRVSPGRTQSSSHQGRLQDRIKGRVQEDFNNDERSFRGSQMRSDRMTDIRTDFSGPKRLAEIKVSKSGESKEQQMEGQESFSLGKRKNLKIEGHQPSECDLSFEGPKPLSEILKRKRGAETSISGSGTLSGNKEENNQRESKERLMHNSITSAVTVTEKECNIHVLDVKEESKSAKVEPVRREDGEYHTQKSEYGQSSQVPNGMELEAEEGMIVDEEDHELEAYDQRDGDFDYEHVDGADYNLDEGENADAEEEYVDDEDVDDFATKIGVMFS